MNATPSATHRDTVDDPDMERKGDDYWAYWPNYLTRMRFSNVHDKDNGLRAELTVFLDLPDVPVPADWTTLDLASGQSRAVIANRLREQWAGPGAPPWREMLGAASYQIRELVRQGEEVIRIGAHRDIRPARYALYPLLPEGQITILYGDGASLKSMIAMGIGMSVQEARPLLPGTNADSVARLSRQGPALYLDYETNADEQNARMRRIAAGFGLHSYKALLYRECHIPIPKEVATLKGLVDEYNSRLVIVDSLGAALGGDPNDAAITIAAMTALRSLGTTVLCIDHVTKTDDQGKPIGSAYKYNYARAAFHAKRVQEAGSDEVRVALIHRKANNGRLVAPMGYKVAFTEEEDGPITISHLDVRDDDELAQHTSIASRIKYEVRRGPKRAPDLQEAMKAKDDRLKPSTFNTTLRRLVQRKEIVILPDGSYALAARQDA